jgi:hypothetical protein
LTALSGKDTTEVRQGGVAGVAGANSVIMETVRVIDTIEGLGAKPVWITPEMRREWKEEGRE